ncbi:MAG: hypothetical protein IT198_05885 [Acidimicrobiia bacterium]|nr:hypothetical protein [Acidimicrobiia bacterium]
MTLQLGETAGTVGTGDHGSRRVAFGVDVRRTAVGHYEVRRDGVRLAEVRSVSDGSRSGWIVRYRATGRVVPRITPRVFATRAAAIESLGA